MRIVLHIGTHKTGTTAIQHALNADRALLRQEGIWYPHEEELLSGGDQRPHHLDLARSLDVTRHPKRYNKQQIDQITRAICTGAQEHATTIISAEAFWRIGFGHPEPDGSNREHLWSIKRQTIQRIRHLFAGAEAEVVVCLREHVHYVQSLYSEFLLSTQYRGSIRQFEKTYRHALSYQRQLEEWGREFPVTVYSYEQLSQNNMLPLELLRRATKRPDLQLPRAHLRANASQPIACIAIKRHLNHLPLDAPLRQKIQRKARKRFQRSSSSTISRLRQANSWCSATELQAIAARFADDDAAVRRHYCPELSSRWQGRNCKRDRSIQPLSTEEELLAIGWVHRKFAPLLHQPAQARP
jgi:hypothetical protein